MARRWLALPLICTAAAAAAGPHSVAAPLHVGAAAYTGQNEISLPADAFVDADERAAVLLGDADLFAEPTSDGAIIARLPAGTVMGYVGESTDPFGRTWSTLRYPGQARRRIDTYLAPFAQPQFIALGGRAAVLANRRPSLGTPRQAEPSSTDAEPPWWAPVSVVTLGHNPHYAGSVGVSAKAVDEAHVLEALDLLGGMPAIANWPTEPLPGELYVPSLLPALFQFDGAEWDLVRPARFFSEALNLLGNPSLLEDVEAPPLAGGPAISCWDLIGALDPSNREVGAVAVAPPPGAGRGRNAAPPPPPGMMDFSDAPEYIKLMLPPAPMSAMVPPRVDPVAAPGGVMITDNDGRQAVFLEQVVGPDLTHRLRGRELILDVVARGSGQGAGGAATVGTNVEILDAAGETVDDPALSFTVGPQPARLELSITVPETADTLVVRLLPLDKSLAVAQSGSVIVDRVSLRLAHWSPELVAAVYVLKRIRATSFESRALHTRAPVALTTRPVEEIALVWPQVQAAVDWSDDDKKLILAGEVRSGMSPGQVRLAWGEPREEVAPTPGTGIDRAWEYGDRKAFFAADRLIAWPSAEKPEVDARRLLCPTVTGTGGGGR